MQIAEIIPCVVTKKFDRPPRNPRSTWTEKNAFLVFVVADNGSVGVGEAWCEGVSVQTLATFVRNDMAPLFIGADVEEVGRLWHDAIERGTITGKPGLLFSVVGAIETALWDLIAKALGRPLFRIMGAHTDRVPAYASGGLYVEGQSPSELGGEMAAYVAKGFRAVKMKVGGAELAEDVKRVAAVREAIGPHTRLMVDAVYMLDSLAALRMARAFDRFDVWFLEAPIAPGNTPGMQNLTRRSPVPIAGNEVTFGLDGYRDLIVDGRIDIVHLDVNQCGGLAEGRRIAALAAAFHRPVSFHSATSAVAFAANLHLAATIANVESIEYHMVHRMLFDQIPEAHFALEDGCIVLPDLPGLGLPIDQTVAQAIK